jgi:hypothetical protein
MRLLSIFFSGTGFLYAFTLCNFASAQEHPDETLPSSCPAKCSANSNNVEATQEKLAESMLAKVELSPQEEKKIKAAAKKFIKELESKHADSYSKQYSNVESYARSFKKLFPTSNDGATTDGPDFMGFISSPGNLDDWIKTKAKKHVLETLTSDDPKDQANKNEFEKALDSLKTVSTQVWHRDSNLKTLMLKARNETDSEKKTELFQKAASDYFSDPDRTKAIEDELKKKYIATKSEYLRKHPDSKVFDKKAINDFEITFSLRPAGTEIPLSEKFSKMTLEEITDHLQMEKSASGNATIYCQPIPATPENLRKWGNTKKDSTEPVHDSKVSPPPLETETIVFEESCDLKQSFTTNLTEVDEASKAKIRECLEKAKSNPACSDGVDNVSARVRSCADTRKSGSEKHPTNPGLSQARAQGMSDAFQDLARSILGIEVSSQRDGEEDRKKYENTYTDSNGKEVLTGTCGPRPPKWYYSQNWMNGETKDPDQWVAPVGCYQPSGPSEVKTCLETVPAKELWKCTPDLPREATPKQIHEYYSGYRRAEIQIQYTCKKEVTKPVKEKPVGGGMAFDQVYRFESLSKAIRSGLFYRCYSPSVGFDFSGGGGGGGKGIGKVVRFAKDLLDPGPDEIVDYCHIH